MLDWYQIEVTVKSCNNEYVHKESIFNLDEARFIFFGMSECTDVSSVTVTSGRTGEVLLDSAE